MKIRKQFEAGNYLREFSISIQIRIFLFNLFLNLQFQDQNRENVCHLNENTHHGRAARLDILCRFVLCKSFRFLNALALNALVRAEPLSSTPSLPYNFAVMSSISFPKRTLPGKIPR